LRHAVYEDTEIPLGTGATLVLYSDGLVERPGEPFDAGLERLQRACTGPPEHPQRLSDRLVATLLPTGADWDDAALMVVTIPRLSDPLTVRLPAEADSITLVRRVIGRWLDAAGASTEEVGEITLACSEACANAIEHAYGPGATEFEIEAFSSNGAVTLVVKDQGKWRPPRGTNRGRGMTLMKGLMDKVELHRGRDGTAVRLTRALVARGA
jgi:anti-sigma regulatory factor (Ser/Thr protein kinase)